MDIGEYCDVKLSQWAQVYDYLMLIQQEVNNLKFLFKANIQVNVFRTDSTGGLK